MLVFIISLVGCKDKEQETFKVYFYLEEKLLKEETVEKGSSATAPTVELEEGCFFVGCIRHFDDVQENIETKAIILKVYNIITFDSFGVDFNDSIQYDVNTSVSYYPNPKKLGINL